MSQNLFHQGEIQATFVGSSICSRSQAPQFPILLLPCLLVFGAVCGRLLPLSKITAIHWLCDALGRELFRVLAEFLVSVVSVIQQLDKLSDRV